MTSLEDENRDALARRFSYMQRKRLTLNSRELPQLRGVLGTNWARGQSLFDFALNPLQGISRLPGKLVNIGHELGMASGVINFSRAQSRTPRPTITETTLCNSPWVTS
jgi:hypothetical protein